uniref:CUE domain-containing protein n=1 Tax=Picea sitchensis TaxID=3332 RepID=A9NV65_PICSI|nr:unknown [Picea sitchensis]
MSALVCGKRSLFEDLHTPPPISKRLRCSGSNSPIRFSANSPTRSPTATDIHHQNQSTEIHHLSQLRGLFPDMDEQHLEAVLESCGNDLASAIKSLNELRLGRERDSIPCKSTAYSIIASHVDQTTEVNTDIGLPVEDRVANDQVGGAAAAIPVNGSDWVELLLQEMQNASNMDDARVRASRALEALEKAIVSRTGSMAENLQKENVVLRQQVEGLSRDNSILKRAVAIQHERQKEHDERGNELQNLKQLLSQYQEQLRTLQVNNYALTLHLRQAQESTSIPGRFHPDVF